MIQIVILIATVVLLAWPVRAWLMRARWTSITPRAAVVLWQAVALSIGVSATAICVELASTLSANPGPRKALTDLSNTGALATPGLKSPDYVFGLTVGLVVVALLFGVLLTRAVGLRRARMYQRAVLDLVASERREAAGAFVVDHPDPVAYSLPGREPRVVVTSGALDALSPDELAGVLAHERAHGMSRFDRTRFLFDSLASALPRSRTLSGVANNVGELLEMAADDRALRECEPATFVHALSLMVSPNTSAVGLEPESVVGRRAQRALHPRPSAGLVVMGTCASSLCIVAVPVVALFVTPALR